jgi:putative lipoprotein
MVMAGSALAQSDPDPWFAPDKALHFSLSAAIAGAGYVGAAFFTDDVRVRLAVGGGLALLAGTAKELADLAGLLGHPSWRDFAWDVIGTVSGLVVAWLIDHFVVTPLRPPLTPATP